MELDAVIPRPRACREHLGVSLTTAWRRERDDPNWPRVVCMGKNRFGYLASDISRYLAGLPDKQKLPLGEFAFGGIKATTNRS